MFGSLYSGNPYGAEYNVPLRNIRPAENQVNIGSGNDTGQDDAFAAFSRFYMPMLQNQTDLWNSFKPSPEALRSGWKFGEPMPTWSPQNPSQDDYNLALHNMFGRAEDAGTLSRYGGFSAAGRRAY